MTSLQGLEKEKFIKRNIICVTIRTLSKKQKNIFLLILNG